MLEVNKLKIDTSDPTAIYLGTSTVKGIYLDTTLVWAKTYTITVNKPVNCSLTITFRRGTESFTYNPTSAASYVVGFGASYTVSATANSGYYFNDELTQATYSSSGTISYNQTITCKAYKINNMNFTMNILSNGQIVSASNGLAYINGENSGDGGIGYCQLDLPNQYTTYYQEELHEISFEATGLGYEFIDRNWSSRDITISFTANPLVESGSGLYFKGTITSIEPRVSGSYGKAWMSGYSDGSFYARINVDVTYSGYFYDTSLSGGAGWEMYDTLKALTIKVPVSYRVY